MDVVYLVCIFLYWGNLYSYIILTFQSYTFSNNYLLVHIIVSSIDILYMVILIDKKNITRLDCFFKKLLKQILSLPQNVADPVPYIISGLIPIEGQIHLKILTFMYNLFTCSYNSFFHWYFVYGDSNNQYISGKSYFHISDFTNYVVRKRKIWNTFFSNVPFYRLWVY
jgi:hypothetical protein